MEKRKLNLMPLKGSGECFLEIELCPSGDFNLGMRGQDTRGEIHYISSQIPNPINAGGNLKNYMLLKEIYDILKKQIQIK